MWSWILTFFGASTIFIAGKKPILGWSIGLFICQPLWAIYGIVTKQFGFLASVGIYGTVFAINLRRSLRQRKEVTRDN